LLSPYKLNVDIVSSGFAAIEKVDSGEVYDVIFMDHMMPVMDGMETTKKLREMNYNGAIVALTANAIAGNAEMFLSNGFDEFLPKPIEVNEMDNILNKYIRDRYLITE
jgi:CheY-like chemotaxis protein